MADYTIGSIIKGQVTGIEKYGAFVSFESGYTGLVHISEIANDFVKDVHDFFEVGQYVYCQILDIDKENLQLRLSTKNINYKMNNKGKVKESRLGFLPLKNKLNEWIADKISEIKNNS
ncbi:MAG: S1 RNA-binding domain-containing protein [Mollicutes bacterium]|nr:S1 RNA-binding domain-containing protein [Mollicutes bacterium]